MSTHRIGLSSITLDVGSPVRNANGEAPAANGEGEVVGVSTALVGHTVPSSELGIGSKGNWVLAGIDRNC